MRLVQLADNLFIKYVASTALAFADAARSLGMEAHLCASLYPNEVKDEVSDKSILTCLDEGDILVLHMESWSTDYLLDFLMPQCKKIVYYYGGLEPESLAFAPQSFVDRCALSHQQLVHLSGIVNLGMASTPFNAESMRAKGFRCPVLVSEPVVPSLFCTDGMTVRSHASSINVLSVGDVLPNRNYEDVLRTFRFYRSAYDSRATLCIVANAAYSDSYYRAIRKYADALSILATEVSPDGSDAKRAFKRSDVLLTLGKSEDQFSGYVTAMRMGIPVVAYAAESVDGILGEAYFKLETRDVVEAARALRDVSSDDVLRGDLSLRGMRRSKLFDRSSATDRIRSILSKMIGGNDE